MTFEKIINDSIHEILSDNRVGLKLIQEPLLM